MGKVAITNMIIQITLSKETVEVLDRVKDILNEQIDSSKGEKKITRSKIINDALWLLFTEGGKIKINKEEA